MIAVEEAIEEEGIKKMKLNLSISFVCYLDEITRNLNLRLI